MTQTLLRIVSQTAFSSSFGDQWLIHSSVWGAFRLLRLPAEICHKLNLNLAKTRLSFVNFRLLLYFSLFNSASVLKKLLIVVLIARFAGIVLPREGSKCWVTNGQTQPLF